MVHIGPRAARGGAIAVVVYKERSVELGEPVDIKELVSDELHNESTCPWHERPETAPDAVEMQEADEDDDNPKKMPKNKEGALGEALGEKADITLELGWIEDTGKSPLWYRERSGKKRIKPVMILEPVGGQTTQFTLQFAPHHLIPGNDALKGSAVVPFLGDDTVIKNFKTQGMSSQIKKGGTVGYNVNCAEKGEWLPSPYALSMGSGGKGWASDEAIKAVAAQLGRDVSLRIDEFKRVYAYAAIQETGKQFHFNHGTYSDEVGAVLKKIGEKLDAIVQPRAEPVCEHAAKTRDDDKVKPPYGLRARLNLLSSNLRKLVGGDDGEVWRAPYFTDNVVKTFFSDHLKMEARAGLKGDIKKVMKENSHERAQRRLLCHEEQPRGSGGHGPLRHPESKRFGPLVERLCLRQAA